MNIKQYYADKEGIALFCILIVISALAAFLSVLNMHFTSDSFEYGLVTQQILSGNGIRVPLVWFNSTIIPSDGTVPFLLHPPLLPIILSAMGGITPGNILPAQILNIVCHVAVSGFTFLFMKRLYGGAIALLSGIVVSFAFPLLKVTHFFWSETLFIALTMAAVYLLVVSRESDRYRFRRVLFAGICASAAIMTRYVGIALVALFCWEFLVFMKRRESKSGYGSIILAAMMPVFTIAGLFMRNYMLSGLMRGIDLPVPERTLLSAFSGTAEMLFMQFQLGRNSAAVIIVFVVLFLICIVMSNDLRKELLRLSRAGLDLLIVFVISYAGLICISMAKNQPNFELRFMAPLVPFLIILIIIMIVSISRIEGVRRISGLSVGVMILLLGMLAAGNFYKTYLNMPYFLNENSKSSVFLESCTYKWIINNYDGKGLVATNKSFKL
ncbi:MAG: glycosyltransferase family 39 protein, partial [Nitrospirota bacterium]|nr:glycosyltransferase family 39 protein [Nitrospirota bacterium]